MIKKIMKNPGTIAIKSFLLLFVLFMIKEASNIEIIEVLLIPVLILYGVSISIYSIKRILTLFKPKR